MNFLRVSFTAASHKTFRRSSVSSNVNMMIRGFATAAGNLESEQVVENRRGDFVNETTYTSRIDSLCKDDRFDDAYRVLNEMIDRRFSPSIVTLQKVLHGFLRIGDLNKAIEMREIMYPSDFYHWKDDGLPYEVPYTSLMNAYLDEGKLRDATFLRNDVESLTCLPDYVLDSVIINGLDKKARTKRVNKYLLRLNYRICLYRPILEYHSTMAENSGYDEFKSVVELVEGICIKGFENVFDTMLKSNYYKPDGIVYNLFYFAHCRHHNVDEAYIMYKEMVHYGFACHIFTVLALIKTLKTENKVNELLWVIQNVLRSCNLNDSEIVKFLNEFNPKEPDSGALFEALSLSGAHSFMMIKPDSEPPFEALFDVLAEKAKDGLFLKCSYAPASA